MYTMDQELAPARRFVFTHQVATVFCVKWRHGQHLETMASNWKSDSVNRGIFTWRTFLPNWALGSVVSNRIGMKFGSLKLFLKRSSNSKNKHKKNNNKLSCDMKSVPDRKNSPAFCDFSQWNHCFEQSLTSDCSL